MFASAQLLHENTFRQTLIYFKLREFFFFIRVIERNTAVSLTISSYSSLRKKKKYDNGDTKLDFLEAISWSNEYKTKIELSDQQ